MMRTRRLSVAIPDELHRRLRHFAIDANVNIADLVVASAEVIAGGGRNVDEILERARALHEAKGDARRRARKGV